MIYEFIIPVKGTVSDEATASLRATNDEAAGERIRVEVAPVQTSALDTDVIWFHRVAESLDAAVALAHQQLLTAGLEAAGPPITNQGEQQT